MTIRRASVTMNINSVATTGDVVYTAPDTTAEVTVLVYATNINGAANRDITVAINKGAAHAVEELLHLVDAYPVPFNSPQQLICTAELKGHKTDPDVLSMWGSDADDIVVVVKIEEDR